jgi:hypothetical protein
MGVRDHPRFASSRGEPMSEEEMSDEELQKAIYKIRPDEEPRIGPTMAGRCDNQECSQYGIITPVSSEAITRERDGRYQKLTCVVCGTLMKVNTGEDGRDFQANYES